MSARASVGARDFLSTFAHDMYRAAKAPEATVYVPILVRFYVSSSRRWATSPAGLELICRRFIMQSWRGADQTAIYNGNIPKRVTEQRRRNEWWTNMRTNCWSRDSFIIAYRRVRISKLHWENSREIFFYVCTFFQCALCKSNIFYYWFLLYN